MRRASRTNPERSDGIPVKRWEDGLEGIAPADCIGMPERTPWNDLAASDAESLGDRTLGPATELFGQMGRAKEELGGALRPPGPSEHAAPRGLSLEQPQAEQHAFE